MIMATHTSRIIQRSIGSSLHEGRELANVVAAQNALELAVREFQAHWIRRVRAFVDGIAGRVREVE
jgi:hypothetical protein